MNKINRKSILDWLENKTNQLQESYDRLDKKCDNTKDKKEKEKLENLLLMKSQKIYPYLEIMDLIKKNRFNSSLKELKNN